MGDKKSNFSLTCSLLSQYLKQKGNLGDLCLDITPNKGILGKSRTPTTMSLLPGVDVSEDCPKSLDLFPFNSTSVHEDMKGEGKPQTLTIFYDGKVLVFDNFPADKANDLFMMANKEMISNGGAKELEKINVGFKVPAPVIRGVEANSKNNNNMVASTSGNNNIEAEDALSKPANASDMPIARRNSLHRFLEKRKDRINVKAPYQVHGSGNGFPAQNSAKSEDGPTWLGLVPHNRSGGSS